MTSQQVLDLKGNPVKEIGLAEDVFGIKPNVGLLHSAVVRQLANARRGTACTKTRSEVAGGGKKPWRQKGTGHARAGSIRSPLWEGGGVTFGPKPRDYSISMPRKQRLLALKSALSASRDNFVVVENLSVKNGKTKEFNEILKALKLSDKKVLLVLDYSSQEACKVELAARNIDQLKVLHVNNLNVQDLLRSEAVLTTEGTLEAITRRFQSTDKSESAGAEKKSKKNAGPEAKPKAKPEAKSKNKPVAEKKSAAAKAAAPEAAKKPAKAKPKVEKD